MADLHATHNPKGDGPNNEGGGRSRGPANRTPRWVKAFGVVIGIVVLLFFVLHLTGYGFGRHMHMSSMEHRGQQL